MVVRSAGDIFNKSLIAWPAVYTNGAAYCAAKFGVTGPSKMMWTDRRALVRRPSGIDVDSRRRGNWGSPAERMITAEDIAPAIVDVYQFWIDAKSWRKPCGDRSKGDCLKLPFACGRGSAFSGALTAGQARRARMGERYAGIWFLLFDRYGAGWCRWPRELRGHGTVDLV